MLTPILSWFFFGGVIREFDSFESLYDFLQTIQNQELGRTMGKPLFWYIWQFFESLFRKHSF